MKQTSTQNTTRDIEIDNKLTVTRGEGGGGNATKKGIGHQETCIKDPWTWTTEWGLTVGAGDGQGRGEQ